MMCSMAAFKEHTAMSFWKAPLIEDPKNLLDRQDSMGHFGRMTCLKDLPSDKILAGFIKQAMKLNKAGVTVERKPVAKEIKVDPPDYFMKALRKNNATLKTYDAFSPSNKCEYIAWVTEAKTEEIPDKRLATAVEWMAEGKIRNWKYVKK